jgi:uncharacterized protein (TIGR03086 family)
MQQHAMNQGEHAVSEISDRYRRVAGQFTQRAQQVPDTAWDNPAPCAGWVARDIVRHMVEWMPGFVLGNWSVEPPLVPSVDDQPLQAWLAVDHALQVALDDPAIAAHQSDSPAGRLSFEDAVAMFCVGEILVHTWDLARATGLDETLDATEVARMVDSIEPMDQAMRDSGHYGPRVAVPADADAQTRLIAFTGRRP